MKNLNFMRFVFIFAFIFIITIIVGTTCAWTQEAKPGKMPPAKSYTVSLLSPELAEIKIDGILGEEAWKEAEIIDLPYEFSPGNNLPAMVKTQCLITFNRSKLFIGFRCYDQHPGQIRAHLMNRDSYSKIIKDDHIAFYMDTFNDERRAFYFMVNPLGVQVDGIFNQLDSTLNFTWDAIWDSAGKITDSGYVIEMAIPFNQLSFPHTTEKQTWGFSIERSYPRSIRYRFISHPWSRDASILLPYINKITGFENMVTGKNLEFDPTMTLHRTDRREEFPLGPIEDGKLKTEPGLTAHWGVSTNLTLHGTVNPDFSHVEADVAQLEVNTRFALYYPEKRPFFLEGLDYFSLPMEMVYTRTVYDPRWGVKMTGKVGGNALGFFLEQDRYNNLLFPANQGSQSTSIEENVLGGVLRYRRDLKKGTLGFLYAGRKSDEYHNHLASVDGVLWLTSRKKLVFQFMHSQTQYPREIAENYNQPVDSFSGSGMYFYFIHLSRNIWYAAEYEDLSSGFRADFGFIPRVDYRKYRIYLQPIVYGKPGGWFERLMFHAEGYYLVNREGELSDRYLTMDVAYFGPLQTIVHPKFNNQKVRYQGEIYDLNQFEGYFEMQPLGGLKYYAYTKIGDDIDFTNARSAQTFQFNPGIEINLGKNIYMNLDHIFERLSVEGKKIYHVNLLQAQLVYNFNVKTFFRAIMQYTDIDRNVDLYIMPTDPTTRTLFTQLLFSYKINPKTVLFLGYSDNHFGQRGLDLTRTDRTFFLKIGYALVL